MEKGEAAREIQEIHSRKERKANSRNDCRKKKKSKSEVKRSPLKIAEISKSKTRLKLESNSEIVEHSKNYEMRCGR